MRRVVTIRFEVMTILVIMCSQCAPLAVKVEEPVVVEAIENQPIATTIVEIESVHYTNLDGKFLSVGDTVNIGRRISVPDTEGLIVLIELNGGLQIWSAGPWAADSHPKDNAATVELSLVGDRHKYSQSQLEKTGGKTKVTSNGDIVVDWSVSRNQWFSKNNYRFKLVTKSVLRDNGSFVAHLRLDSETWGLPGARPQISLVDLKADFIIQQRVE